MFAWLREGKAVKSWPPRSVSRCRPAHLFGKRRRRPPNARNSLRPHCPTDPGAHELAAPPPLHKIFKFVSSSAPDSNIPFLTTLFPAWSGFFFLPELSKIQTRCRFPDSKGLDCSPLPIAQSRNVCARHRHTDAAWPRHLSASPRLRPTLPPERRNALATFSWARGKPRSRFKFLSLPRTSRLVPPNPAKES